MKKLLLIGLGIFLLIGAFAFVVLPSGTILLSKQEFSSLTNNQISNYMANNLQMTRYKVMDDRIIVYYNLTYIEPSTNGTYRVFIQEKPFKIGIDLYEYCLNVTTLQNCKNYLVDRETPFKYNITKSYGQDGEIIYETEEIIITSTYYKAFQEQKSQYERAKKFRDKAIYNSLEDLGALI